jgi:hypothetical protein
MLTLVLLFRTALLLHDDRLAAIFAATLAIFGSTIFNVGPIAIAANRLVGARISEGRGLAALKYVRVNSMPIGMAFFALYLWAIFRVFRKPDAAGAGDYIVLGASVLGSGFYYPLTWLPLMASLFAACAAFVIQYGKESRRTLLYVSSSTIITVVCLLPYLDGLRAGQDSLLSPTSDVASLLGKGVRLTLSFSLVALLAWWERDVIRELLAKEPGRLTALLSTILTTAVMYIVVNANGNEYKFLILSCLTLGILAGGLLAKVYRTRRARSFLMLVGFLIPVSSDWIVLFRLRNMPIADPYVEQGMYLRHKTLGEDRLYQWIDSQTPGDSLFIDTYLTIPVFGRRALYAGLDHRWASGTTPNRDGWSLTAADLIRQEGHPRKLVKSRVEVSNRVLDPKLPITPADLSQLKRTMGNQHVYIVARNPATREKLDADGRFQLAFTSDAASVFFVH